MYILSTLPRYILTKNKTPLNTKTYLAHNAQDSSIWQSQQEIKDIIDKKLECELGFVFQASDNYFFIDIDNCLINNAWSPLAIEICSRFVGCYVEISKSGKGLHVIGRYDGVINPHSCKRADLKVELYTEGRFVVLTKTSAQGNMDAIATTALNEFIKTYFSKNSEDGTGDWTTESLEGLNVPERNDEVLHIIYDLPAGSEVFGSKGHATFKDLFEANEEELAKFYPSSKDTFDRSSADSALAYRLHYFLGGNCERVKQMMGLSMLYRDKWNREDYLPRTIISARGKQTKFFSYPNKKNLTIVPEANVPEKISVISAGCQLYTRILEKTDYPILNTALTKPLDVTENLKFLLDKIGITCRWNDMKRCRDIVIPNFNLYEEDAENQSLTIIKDIALRNHLTINRIDEHLDFIAQNNCYHPIVEKILSNPWDGNPRVDTLVKTLSESIDEMVPVLIRTWLIQAVVAAFSTKGVSSHGVLVLKGPQGLGKTTWLKKLDCWGLNAVREAMILDPANKDLVLTCASHWIVELGELDGTLRRTDIARLKSHLTSNVDVVRRPFAKKDSRLFRRTVYAASVNSENFLVDMTGNRRFWVIPIENEINNNHDIDIAQVWAEVYTLWQAGEKSWLNSIEESQLNKINEKHELIDPFEELFLRHYDISEGWEDKETTYRSTTEILQTLGYSNINKSDATRMGLLLKKLLGRKARNRYHLVPIFKPR